VQLYPCGLTSDKKQLLDGFGLPLGMLHKKALAYSVVVLMLLLCSTNHKDSHLEQRDI